MAYQFGAFGSYPFPNFTGNFSQQYGPTPYNPTQMQPQSPQPQMQPQNPQPQQAQSQATANGHYYYVNGIEGAKAFLLPPNASAILFDSDSHKFFVKSTNQQGQAILKEFEYNEILPKTAAMPQQAQPDKYITREEFEQAKAEITSLLAKQAKAAKEVTK